MHPSYILPPFVTLVMEYDIRVTDRRGSHDLMTGT